MNTYLIELNQAAALEAASTLDCVQLQHRITAARAHRTLISMGATLTKTEKTNTRTASTYAVYAIAE